MGILDFIFSSIFLIITYNLKNFFSFTFGEEKLIKIIFFYHTAVCFAATPILFYGGDAHNYWMIPKKIDFNTLLEFIRNNPRPTEIMYLINYLFSNILDLNFLSGMLFYSMLGMLAFLLILQTVKSFIPKLTNIENFKINGIPIYPYIFLLPNMHFWSVGVGKDTLLFFAVSLFIYSLINIKSRFIGVIIASLIAYYLRPHILLFLVAGIALGYEMSKKFPMYQKVILTSLMLVAFLPLFNETLEFAKIDQFSSEHLDKFADSKASALSNAGSGIDISSYPYPLKVLTFLFRPLFFDAGGIAAVVASVENLMQIFLLLFFIRNRFFTFISNANYLIRGCFFYYLIGAFAFAPVMSNLGIIIREKNMMMPAFLIFILGSIQYKRLYGKQKINKNINSR